MLIYYVKIIFANYIKFMPILISRPQITSLSHLRVILKQIQKH